MPAYAHDQYERGRHVMAETETDKSSAASSVEKGSSGKPHSIITYGINIAITTRIPTRTFWIADPSGPPWISPKSSPQTNWQQYSRRYMCSSFCTRTPPWCASQVALRLSISPVSSPSARGRPLASRRPSPAQNASSTTRPSSSTAWSSKRERQPTPRPALICKRLRPARPDQPWPRHRRHRRRTHTLQLPQRKAHKHIQLH